MGLSAMLARIAVLLAAALMVYFTTAGKWLVDALDSNSAVNGFLGAVLFIVFLLGLVKSFAERSNVYLDAYNTMGVDPVRLTIFSLVSGSIAACIAGSPYILSVPPAIGIDPSEPSANLAGVEFASEAWWAGWWETHPFRMVKASRVIVVGAILGFVLNMLLVETVVLTASNKTGRPIRHKLSWSIFVVIAIGMAGVMIIVLSNLSEIGREIAAKTVGDELLFGSGVCRDIGEYWSYGSDKGFNGSNNTRCDVGPITLFEIVMSLLFFSCLWIVFIRFERSRKAMREKSILERFRANYGVPELFTLFTILVFVFGLEVWDPVRASDNRQWIVGTVWGIAALSILFCGVAWYSCREFISVLVRDFKEAASRS